MLLAARWEGQLLLAGALFYLFHSIQRSVSRALQGQRLTLLRWARTPDLGGAFATGALISVVHCTMSLNLAR